MVTARILVSGLVGSEMLCIAGLVVLEAFGRPAPAALGHLASATAGALAMGFSALFKGAKEGN